MNTTLTAWDTDKLRKAANYASVDLVNYHGSLAVKCTGVHWLTSFIFHLAHEHPEMADNLANSLFVEIPVADGTLYHWEHVAPPSEEE